MSLLSARVSRLGLLTSSRFANPSVRVPSSSKYREQVAAPKLLRLYENRNMSTNPTAVLTILHHDATQDDGSDSSFDVSTSLTATSRDKAPISKASLLSAHKTQLSNGFTNDDNVTEIAAIFGGIDSVVDHILSSPFPLDEVKLRQLSTIICRNRDRQGEAELEDENVTFVFYHNASFLHSMFPHNHGRVEKTIDFVHSKRVICLLILVWLFWLVLQAKFGEGLFANLEYDSGFILYCVFSITVHVLLFIPWIVVVVLSLNKAAIRKVRRTIRRHPKDLSQKQDIFCRNS